jgi:hypothetical protein
MLKALIRAPTVVNKSQKDVEKQSENQDEDSTDSAQFS